MKIEEDMKILEGIIKGDEDCINAIYSQMKVKNDNDEDIQYYKKEIQSIKNIVDNYLKEKARADKLEKEYSAMLTESDENECDYKRVLKENEELKQDRNNNYQMIVLAQNDMLNYQAGFEDGKNGRTSAVQSIIENQQYYIFQKQIEKYERHIEKLQKENEEWQKAYQEEKDKQFELIQNTNNTIKTAVIAIEDLQKKLKEVIPVQKVKDKIEEILNNGEYRIIFEGDAEFPDEATCIDAQKYIKLEKLQELLEGRK